MTRGRQGGVEQGWGWPNQEDIVNTSDLVARSEVIGQSAVVRATAPFITGRMRLRDVWNLQDFSSGAVFVGNDDTAVLQTAIAECRAAERALHLPAGVAGVSDRLVYATDTDGNGLASFAIRGAGADRTTIESSLASAAMFQTRGKIQQGTGSGQALLSDAAEGQWTLAIDTTAEGGVQAGDLLHLRDIAQGFYGTSDHLVQAVAGESVRVLSVDSSTSVTLQTRLEFAYPAATATWRKPSNVPFIGISDLKLTQLDTVTTASKAIVLQGVDQVFVENIVIDNFCDDGIVLNRVAEGRIINPVFTDLRNDQSPYCIALAEYTQNVYVHNPKMRNGRHLITTTGDDEYPGPAHCMVAFAQVWDHYWAALDTHWDARNITFFMPMVHGGQNSVNAQGVQMRGRNCRVIEPQIKNCHYGVSFPFGVDNALLKGGVLDGCDYGVNIDSSDGVRVYDTLIRNPRTSAIWLKRTNTSYTMTDLKVRRVEVEGDPSTSAVAFDTYNSAFEIDVSAPSATTKRSGSSAPTNLSEPGFVLVDRGAILPGGTSTVAQIFQNPSGALARNASNSAAGLFPITAARLKRAGRTTKLRFYATVAVDDDVPPAANLNVRFRAATVDTGTMPTALSGTTISTLSFSSAELTAGAVLSKESDDLALPADGTFALYAELSQTSAAGGGVLIRSGLQVRYE